MKPTTREWTDKAEGDYQVAADQRRSPAPVYDAVCFHAQQVAEKYLKAWLAEHDVGFPRIHDLVALAGLCAPSLDVGDDVLERLRFLTSFAVEIRYPGTTAQREDAEQCWEAAQQVRALVRSRLGLG